MKTADMAVQASDPVQAGNLRESAGRARRALRWARERAGEEIAHQPVQASRRLEEVVRQRLHGSRR